MPAATRSNPQVRRGARAAEAVHGGGFGRTTLQRETYTALEDAALLAAMQPLLAGARDIAQRFQAALRIPVLTPADQDLLVAWVTTFLSDAYLAHRVGASAAEQHARVNLQALQQASPTLAHATSTPAARDALERAWKVSTVWFADQVDRLIGQFFGSARTAMPELNEALRSPGVWADLQAHLQERFSRLFPGTLVSA